MPLNVVIASPEILPFAKTGGLADVTGALPLALKKLNCNVTLFMPLYREVLSKGFDIKPVGLKVTVAVGKHSVDMELFKGQTNGVPAYFLKKDEYFDRTYLYTTPHGDYFDNLERFTAFSKGVLEAIIKLNMKPDVIHCNDWQTGLIPAYLKSIYKERLSKTSSIFTIHNIAYQGVFPAEFFDITGLPWNMYNPEGIEFYGKINLLKSGIVYSDIINTVSEKYSKEIQTPNYGHGLEGILIKRKDSLFGVLNGADYSEWNPITDKHIKKNYSSNDLKGKEACKKDLLKEYSLKIKAATPVIGMITRLAGQKGFDILAEAIAELMELNLSIVILGTGEKKYHDLFEELKTKYPEKLGVNISFDNTLAHKIEAGSDLFLMPSRYEPCGLNQIYSLKYGTIPIVRATGGLDDTIKDYKEGGNGFKFSEYSKKALVNKVKEALTVYNDKKAWEELKKKIMEQDFSWEKSAKKYISLYDEAGKKIR